MLFRGKFLIASFIFFHNSTIILLKSYQNVIKVHSFTTNLQQVNVLAAIQFLKNIKHVANRCKFFYAIQFLKIKKLDSIHIDRVGLLIQKEIQDLLKINHRDRSRAAETSKMERFVKIVNGWRPLTIITKRSILDVVAALDPPLNHS